MKKKYTHYKVNLLIGLFSLNGLCSCVNTRRALGVDDIRNHHIEGIDDRPQDVSRVDPIVRSRLALWAGHFARIIPNVETLLTLGAWFTAGYLFRESYYSKPDSKQLYINATTSEQKLLWAVPQQSE